MTKQERERNYNTVFKHPIFGRLCALVLLLTFPLSVPLILTFEAIANGELSQVRELWEIVKWNDKESTDD